MTNQNQNPYGDNTPKEEDYDRALRGLKYSKKTRDGKSRNPDFRESHLEDNRPGMISRGLSYLGNSFGKGIQSVKQLPYQIIAPVLLGLTIGITSGVTSYNHESYRDSKKQLGFSEISQIMDDVSKQGLVPGEGTSNATSGMARTLYQAGLNDLTMKIIEDSNLSHEDKGDFYSNFSARLKDRLDPTKKKHGHELNELFDMVNDSSKKVREEYSAFTQIRNTLPGISKLFNDSWTENHHDNYHTEIYLETVEHTSTDSYGHTSTYTTLEPKTRQVYDDTDHWYYYHPENANPASASLENLIRSSGDIRIKEPYYTAKKIKEQNKSAVLKSRTEKEAPKLSENDLLGIVNTWHSGSTLVLNENEIYPGWSNLINDSNEWSSVKKDAKNHHYRTNYSSDSGPLEYKVAYKTRDQINAVNRLLDESISLLDYNDKNISELRAKINQFVQVNNSKERKRLGKEVLSLTQDIYQANFKKGFEVDRFRTSMIFLWSFLGTIAGAGAGLGLGYGIDKLKENFQ